MFKNRKFLQKHANDHVFKRISQEKTKVQKRAPVNLKESSHAREEMQFIGERVEGVGETRR